MVFVIETKRLQFLAYSSTGTYRFAASFWLNFCLSLQEFKLAGSSNFCPEIQSIALRDYHVVMAQWDQKRISVVFAIGAIWLKAWVCSSKLEKIRFNTLGPNFTLIIGSWELPSEVGGQKSDLLLWADRQIIFCYTGECDLPCMLKKWSFK